MIDAPRLRSPSRRDIPVAKAIALSLLLAGLVAVLAMSRGETTHARAVESRATPAHSPAIVPSRDAAGEAAALLGASLPLAAPATPDPDRRLEMRLAADDLFLPGSAELRAETRPVVARIAAWLAAQPPGARAELEARFTVGWPQTSVGAGVAAEATREVAIRRAGALMRALREAGAPVAGLTAGLDHGAAGELQLRLAAGGAAERPAPRPIGG